MCNGFSTRTSAGGAIAVLRPTSTLLDSCCLQFHNNPSDSSPTNLSYILHGTIPDYEVRIHSLGDLTVGASSAGEIVYSLLLLKAAAAAGSGLLALDRRLELGVGGDGIIGRVISVVGKGGVVLGEGIIGWN
ncbi:hypothetical protein BDD12DRAFT_873869 [Trichophaea hybrida]|nr:hypothetical protein BDD12DRAFT_873869 [Trichophaea hybrida]